MSGYRAVLYTARPDDKTHGQGDLHSLGLAQLAGFEDLVVAVMEVSRRDAPTFVRSKTRVGLRMRARGTQKTRVDHWNGLPYWLQCRLFTLDGSGVQ